MTPLLRRLYAHWAWLDDCPPDSVFRVRKTRVGCLIIALERRQARRVGL
jgi:hypothetical protein